jgi:hypothetical protein
VKTMPSTIHAAACPAASPHIHSDKPETVAANHLERYSGTMVPVVGGLIQAAYGVKEIKSGDPLRKRNGDIDLTLGSANFASTCTNIPLYASKLMAVPHALTAIAGPVSAVASVVSSVVDGGRDIYNGFKLHQTEPKVEGSAKILAGGVMAFGAATINIPVMIAGTIMYGAVGAIQNRGALIKVARHVYENPKQALHEACDSVSNQAHQAIEKTTALAHKLSAGLHTSES